jgi:signal peptidase II
MNSTDSNRKRNLIFAIAAVVTIILDQWTKILARAELKALGPWRTITVVENYFDLRLSENTGVAFGMFNQLPGGRIVLSLVAFFALGLVWYYLTKTGPQQTRLHLALGLIGGGAVGNLIDRVAFGRVTDFIVWHIHQHEWPAFNIADAALVVGVGLMALDMFRTKQPETAKVPPGGGP